MLAITVTNMCLCRFLGTGAGADGKAASSLCSRHSMRCFFKSSWLKEILATSWPKAEWYATAVLNKPQSVAPFAAGMELLSLSGHLPSQLVGKFARVFLSARHQLSRECAAIEHSAISTILDLELLTEKTHRNYNTQPLHYTTVSRNGLHLIYTYFSL